MFLSIVHISLYHCHLNSQVETIQSSLFFGIKYVAYDKLFN